MSANLIHVRYSDKGSWVVQPDDRSDPISEHGSETAAERAAIEHASGRDDCDVVVHDRYARVHFVGRPARDPRTRDAVHRSRSGDG
jgi:Uncharacterized protein conserved in bacteria (DUF2188)